MRRSYSRLIELPTFEERYHYLALRGTVGGITFGDDRPKNQRFYTSREWRDVRNFVIVRDGCCDLGIEEFYIFDTPYIHHINPMDIESLVHGHPSILDPENLITTTHRTHNAIHYGDESQLPRSFVPRRPGDTKEW